MHRLSVAFSFALFLAGCGGSSSEAAGSAAVAPRPGPAVDLIALVPSGASVVLHADLNAVRQDTGRYDRLASQLATELGLAADSATLRALLDRTDEAVGVFMPGGSGGEEGMLLFTGRYSDQDFESALAIASARHPGQPSNTSGSDGRRVVELGAATLVQLDTWTWAVVQGPQLRAHVAAVPLHGARTFARDLIEFGPRIGLPQGAAQAWADQNSPAGVDMVALVFQGETPQMVQSFVATVRRHLGL
jgi:hypothetical protein